MCQKAIIYVDTCLFILDYVPDYYKTQEIREKAVSKEPMLKYCLDTYKTQKTRDEADVIHL